MFFGNHLPELIILLIVALVIFGPKRLPEIGGAMGRGIREFRKGTSTEADKESDGKTKESTSPAQIPQAPEPVSQTTPPSGSPEETATPSQTASAGNKPDKV